MSMFNWSRNLVPYMDQLPAVKDRVVGEKYLSKNRIVIWDGRKLRCEHNRRRDQCKLCGGSGICEHNQRKHYCKICGGGSICEHGIRKSQCKLCGGSQICQHNRIRSSCRECGGGGICTHGIEKYRCKICGGNGICEHGKQISRCIKCGGGSICEHGRDRFRCRECEGNAFCEHDKNKNNCLICKPTNAISNLLRDRFRKALKQGSKSGSAIDLLGCSLKEFRVYLQSLFEDGMSWENYGDWHIDHRRPCNSFNLLLEDEQQMCFHYTNLQPLWAEENISKMDKFDETEFMWEWDGEKWVEKQPN